uniref:F-box domain-containing protein n=1 Tax=Solanum lycopersicum TaxID=4081 RepID=A0A3Q7JAW3_SOLLC
MAKRVGGEDIISELPLHIIHHILCRTNLDLKDAAISCMLSKRWYHCWTSRPNLIFNQLQGDKLMPLENYVKLVDQSLRSHIEKKLHLEQFILAYCDPEVDSHLDTWIELAVKLNVTELGFDLVHRRSGGSSRSQARFVQVTLPWKRRDIEIDPSKIKSIQKLPPSKVRTEHFHRDPAQNPIVKKEFGFVRRRSGGSLRSQARFVQVTLPRKKWEKAVGAWKWDKGRRRVVIGIIYLGQNWSSGHIKYLTTTSCELHSVIVQAPYLRCFRYKEYAGRENILPCEIAILDGYNTLQTLELVGASITGQHFQDIFCKFPNISELELESCYKLNHIEIQSEKLKKFTLLLGLNTLEKLTIQAPNLLDFDFRGTKIPFSYMNMDTSSLERARFHFFMPATHFGSVDNSWYTSLHHFVQQFK